MSKDTFFSMRQLNFILWIAALVTTWHDPRRLPVGAQWIPFAGVIVALFVPRKRKSETAAQNKSAAGQSQALARG